MEEKDRYKIKLGFIEISIISITVLLIGFSFFAPNLFVKETMLDIDFSKTGQIGDTIGGIMNPFIAIAGVLLTFLAFYIQYKANRLQRDLFRDELDEQKDQFKKTQFEGQFYEMLKLHKDNVNEIQLEEIKLYIHTKENGEKQIDRVEKTINGRKTFNFLKNEFEILYFIAKKNFPDKEPKIWVNEAYGIFFHGLNENDITKHNFFKDIDKVKKEHEKNHYTNLPTTFTEIISQEVKIKDNLRYKLFEGYSYQLAHYYRHLYQTVKFVVNQDSKLLTYIEKRKYLRILRAQLSNQEQTMLFYNWLSDFGNQWNNDTNKFFTDYRMIHNIYQELIVEDVKLNELFDIDGDYLKEDDREFDPLFEYQDW